MNKAFEKRKKCTGESGDIGDIAKNVKIAMQKKDIALFALSALWSEKVQKVQIVQSKK